MSTLQFSDASVQALYEWLDSIPLSRPKRNIARDFSDGVLVAEVIHHFLPRLVDLHNYSPANASSQKRNNWDTLKTKVLNKLKIKLDESNIKDVIECRPMAIENVLLQIQQAIAKRILIDEEREKERAANRATRTPIFSDNRSQIRDSPRSILKSRIDTPGSDEYTREYDFFGTKQQHQQQQQITPKPLSLQQFERNENTIHNNNNNIGRPVTLSPMPTNNTSYNLHSPQLLINTQNSNTASQNMQIENGNPSGEYEDPYEVIHLLETKIEKLETLVSIKDERIKALVQRLQDLGLEE